jgi:hypothetical protein
VKENSGIEVNVVVRHGEGRVKEDAHGMRYGIFFLGVFTVIEFDL